MKRRLRSSLLWCGVNLLRLLLAATFIFSGLVKLIDPRGTQYKIEDYAAAFGLSEWMIGLLPLALSVTLATTEFALGVQMLLGVRRRWTTWMVCIFLALMTPLTLYLYLSDVVVDCGCFGDVLVLTNAQTLLKNVVLLAAAVVTACYHRLLTSSNTERTQWLVSFYSWTFAVVFAGFNIYGLPMVDFRPFKVGTNLQERRADLDDMSIVQDFGMWSLSAKDDITDDVLAHPGYKFLLAMPTVEMADDGVMDRLMALTDYARAYHYPLYALTSSGEEAIARWCDITGAEYSFCQTDATVLKTMIRSNPGLVLLHGATIVGKWADTELPSDEQLLKPLHECAWAREQLQADSNRYLRVLWSYLVPLIVCTVLDRLWWLWKRYRKKRNDKSNLLKKKTMRKKIVAGNWKMNKTLQEGVALATELKDMMAAEKPNCEVIIGTPFIHLATVSELLKDSVIAVSAENCANKESGAYTGEVSAAMVKSTGAEYVILGHSERREYYNETPEILKDKVDLALANGLKVIFCIGESLAEREANQQEAVCKAELAGSVFHLTAEQWKNIVIAYEPIWAIGTGKTATSDQAEEIHAYIRKCVAEVYGAEIADETSILYGGSCKASNAPELFAKPDIDGGLIGGASLKAPDFKGIIDAWK